VGLAIIGVILAVGGVFFGAVGAFVAIALYFLYITIMVNMILSSMIGLLSRRNQQLDDILNGVDARGILDWLQEKAQIAGELVLPGSGRLRFEGGGRAFAT
jgi:hypothetical protein